MSRLLLRGGGIGKAKAFNRGLDCARGEYVMFLSGDDFILPYTVHFLCKICAPRNSIFFRKENIFHSVQYLEENPEGNISIDGIENKRFFHCVDQQFDKLNELFTFQSNDYYQKLLMTGSQVFNPFLGTKFFKREFLTENALRFNENIETNIELPFIANAVMFSDEILFVPEVFYVAPPKS